MNKNKTLFASLTLPALLASAASADLAIYEPFDYADTSPTSDTAFLGDTNQAGGLGLAEWRQTIAGIHEIEVIVPGLTFTDANNNELPSSGGYLYRSNRVGQAAVSSDLDPSATSTLTADGSTMWMSFLYVDRGFSGPTSAIMLTSEDMIASDNHSLETAGFGVGVAIRDSGNMTRAINSAYYNDTTDYARVPEPEPTFLVSGGPENTVFLIALKVNWKPDGELDEIFVFKVTDLTAEPDEADALASDTFDMSLVNQQSLDVLNIGETQVDGFDEIRFGTTFGDVTNGSSGANTLSITNITYTSESNEMALTWNSNTGASYIIKYSTDLINWDNDLEDGIPADDGDATTKIFDLSEFGLEGEAKTFFRVEKE
ncbi:MAG: hypothetical protein ACJAVK_001606 [Akkermansiaceae bacterium]|jgi:hypothetical protein